MSEHVGKRGKAFWERLKAERHAKRHSKPEKYGPNGRLAQFKQALHTRMNMERLLSQ